MASLRDAVRAYQDELREGISWVAFWRESRLWNSDYICNNCFEASDPLTIEDRERLQEIQTKDPAAIILNGYSCYGYLDKNGYSCGNSTDDMSLDGLIAGVRYHYENSINTIIGFIEAHEDSKQ